ncbi:hypothetical protein E2C01_037597 [Portunus trituberculatus]|uniref:Uncharacterized protein n=1 Tax=Portunus trituberculatus TaxID=210409 RepID=A0A5B7FG21_PORTR|nr:hypothetical protein [Portunus trituberculatus]
MVELTCYVKSINKLCPYLVFLDLINFNTRQLSQLLLKGSNVQVLLCHFDCGQKVNITQGSKLFFRKKEKEKFLISFKLF